MKDKKEDNENNIKDSLEDKYLASGKDVYHVVGVEGDIVKVQPLDAEAFVSNLWDKRSNGSREPDVISKEDILNGKYTVLSDEAAQKAISNFDREANRLDGMMQEKLTGKKAPVYYAQVAYIDSGEDREILDGYVEKEDYSRLLDDAEDYASACDYEIDLAETFKNGPTHYPGDSLIASNKQIAVVQNRVGDYAVFYQTDKAGIMEVLEDSDVVREDYTLDYEHEWSDDVKEVIEEMRNARREKDMVARLGEGYSWKAETPYDAIEIGVESRLDDRITGIDVKDGHLLLHGVTATAGGPDKHEITAASLDIHDWNRIKTFTDNQQAEINERKIAGKLGEGFSYSFPNTTDGIEMDSDEPKMYITSVYVENGHLKLYGKYPEDLNPRRLETEWLSHFAWNKLGAFAQQKVDERENKSLNGVENSAISALVEIFTDHADDLAGKQGNHPFFEDVTKYPMDDGSAYSFDILVPGQEPQKYGGIYFDTEGKLKDTVRIRNIGEGYNDLRIPEELSVAFAAAFPKADRDVPGALEKVSSLSPKDFSNLLDYVRDLHRQQVNNDPRYAPIKKVWDVWGQKGSEYEIIRKGLTDTRATNFVAKHSQEYAAKGYDMIYTTPSYIIDDREAAEINVPSRGRWSKDLDIRMIRDDYYNNLLAIGLRDQNTTGKKDGKVQITKDYFVPDKHAAKTAILSVDAMAHDHIYTEYYNLKELFDAGLRVDKSAKPVHAPEYLGDKVVGSEELWARENTDFLQKARYNDRYKESYHNSLINSTKLRDSDAAIKQLAFLNKDGGIEVADTSKALEDLKNIDASYNKYMATGQGESQKETEAQTENIPLSDQNEVSKEAGQEESQDEHRPRGLRL